MKSKLTAFLLPAVLLIAACSGNNNPASEPASATSTSAIGLKNFTADGFFSLPSSMQSAEPSIEITAKTAGLARIALTTPTPEDLKGLEAYKLVPAYIHIAEVIKDSVRVLINNLGALDLGESYQGVWDGYDVTLKYADSLFENEKGKAMQLVLKKDTIVVMNLNYLVNARNQFRGACYYHSDKGDSVKILMRFNTFNEDVFGKRMVLWVTTPESLLKKANDPSVLRISAVRTPKGIVKVSGLSLHPTFQADGFWLAGPKIYGFQAVSNPDKDQTVLRLAFADKDSVDSDFFTKKSLDNAVANRAAVLLADKMVTEDTLGHLISYSIEKNRPIDSILSNPVEWLAVLKQVNTAATFSGTDLKTFLEVNRSSIQNGKDEGLKMLYFMTMVKQPIFLDKNATIVGYDTHMPSEFALKGTVIEEENVSSESIDGITNPITEDSAIADLDGL
jgi:hypothetical protein